MPGTAYAIKDLVDYTASGPNRTYRHATQPEVRFQEDDQTDPAGRFRVIVNADIWTLQRAATADFATFTNILSVSGVGAVTIAPIAGQNLNITLATTGDFAVNTNQLYVDTSAAVVGIGTATPATSLEISSAVAGIGATIRLTNTQGAAADLTAAVRFEAVLQGTGGAQRAGIIDIGKVGDFETSPDRSSFMAFSIVSANTVTERLRINSTGVSFYAVAPVARAAALTQTYATTSRTHANMVAVAVATTGSTQTTPFGYTTAAQADAIVTAINALINSDVVNAKQIMNSVIDDLQAYGLEQ